jgi:hypothetical protein
MPEKDPEHWLYRLTPTEWLTAAENELSLARMAFAHKQQRPAVAHARRAAGMALNALLWHQPDPAYGRSYMEHLQALCQDSVLSEELRAAATRLVKLPMNQELVTLGPRGDGSQSDPAALIIDYVRGTLKPSGQA